LRKIRVEEIKDVVTRLCIDANHFIGKDVMEMLEKSLEKEESPVGKNILEQIIKNDKIAANELVPMCQDTGLTVVFLEIGNEVFLEGDIYEAVQEGVRKAYKEAFLRKSIVRHPLDRVNTGDNTPAVIYTEIVKGDKIKVIIAPKGGGSENMSLVKMLKPADGIEGVKELVVETVKNAGGNPCPPIVVGVGLGGTFEKAAILAKKALLRELDDKSENPIDRKLEEDLLDDINKLGIGPMGLGGTVTALAVKVESHPCHIASLPVAININCHAARHKEAII